MAELRASTKRKREHVDIADDIAEIRRALAKVLDKQDGFIHVLMRRVAALQEKVDELGARLAETDSTADDLSGWLDDQLLDPQGPFRDLEARVDALEEKRLPKR